MRKSLFFVSLFVTALACSLPGAPAPVVESSPPADFDAGFLQTAIVQTAGAAQTQTAAVLPTQTFTPTVTRTPSITPTFTPTFIFLLQTSTPIPSMTLPVTVSAGQLNPSGGENGEKDKKDPKRMTGKEWSCSTLGASPPRDTVIQPGTRFTVTWTVFNSGTKAWPLQGVDFVYTGGFRHENTKIQDFTQNVPSGGEIRVSATFVAPERPDVYQSFFTLQVGKLKFCGIKYVFYVAEK